MGQNRDQKAMEHQRLLLQIDMDALDGHDFEIWCARLLLENGFDDAVVTQKSSDQGVDIVAVKSGVRWAIQCKRYQNSVGNKSVQEVYSGMNLYNCSVGAVMTNSSFTKNAVELAKATGIVLWDRSEIIGMLRSVRTKLTEAERKPREYSGQEQDNNTKKVQATAENRQRPVYKNESVTANSRPEFVHTKTATNINRTKGKKKTGWAIIVSAILIIVFLGVKDSKWIVPGYNAELQAQIQHNTNLLNGFDHCTVNAFDDLRFGITQSQLEPILQNTYGLRLDNMDYEQLTNPHIRQIVAPKAYPENDSGFDVCFIEYGFPDSFKLYGLKVNMVQLYYVSGPVDGKLLHDASHYYLYGIKTTYFSEKYQSDAQSLKKSIVKQYGKEVWTGIDASKYWGVEGLYKVKQLDTRYTVWKRDGKVIVLSVPNGNQKGVQDINISLFYESADNLIDGAIALAKK